MAAEDEELRRCKMSEGLHATEIAGLTAEADLMAG